MNQQMRDALAAMPARQLNLIAIGVVAIVAMLAWTFALRAPLAAFRQQQAALAALQASGPVPVLPAGTAASGTPAPAAAPAAPPDPLVLIGAVSRSAAAAGVAVSSAAPGTGVMAAGLRRQTLDVTASGGYGALLAWLDDIERTQPAVGIVQLDLHPGEPGGRRAAKLQLAIYQTGNAP